MDLYEFRILYTLRKAGIKTDDPELGKRILSVLRNLLALSNGATSRHGLDIAKGKAGSSPPRRAHSWYDVYLERFRRAPTEAALVAQVNAAEVACRTEQGHNPVPRNKTGPENDDEAMARVIEWYEGVPAETVAEQEGDHRLVEWVEKARRLHRRNESDGFPRRGWEGWDDERRAAEIAKLHRKGLRLTTAANKLQVSERSVQKYWPGQQRRAA